MSTYLHGCPAARRQRQCGWGRCNGDVCVVMASSFCLWADHVASRDAGSAQTLGAPCHPGDPPVDSPLQYTQHPALGL